MGILLFYIIMKKLSKSESTFFWKKKTENYRNIEAFLKNCGYLSLKRYTYSDVKKITNSFRTKVGQGGFGCVFKGKLENDCLVAVKVLKGLKGNGEDFINEVATISRTSHVNIVTLLGFCFEGRHRALIYEFMPSGSILIIGFGCVFKGKLENDCLVAVKVLKGLKGNGEDFINEVATISRTSHVNIVTLLGFCFEGKLENDCLVAVKVLKGLKGNGEDFINEVATISRTSHVNIVTLLGFCFEGRHRALIYEFMPSGSLDNFIHDGGSSTYRQLGWDAMHRIAVGIARGLEYLHRGCKTRILHFDIKPHNILLDEHFCPKISDFGLAKLCPQKESIISLTGARGTAGYIAPEVFSRNFGGVSPKSDVYSYGMMVLEMVGGRKNISVEVDCTSEIYFPHWVYKRLELDEELGLHGITGEDDESNASARKMIIVGLWCIQTIPSNRPSMSRVVEMLEGSTESLQIPPKPYLSSPSRAPVDSSTTHVITL
ncbi:hypothetical protein RHMOL_Rhmol09G0151000 [Rhododendron molle]|uniref:Uncharacterized protein n=1 Tax=Rhododendron molle TaxID=49168 RepID=A0ACC0MEQ3_RHOML|nr:hypothetical protein RHMOL_Rhmol09G0151000 [Rhododendron molle]